VDCKEQQKEKMMKKLIASVAVLCLFFVPLLLHAAQNSEIKRIRAASPQSPILAGVVVPSSASTFYLSGQVPAVADATKPAESIDAYGDTKTQPSARSTRSRGCSRTRGCRSGM
jgi:hypothetical protein